MRCIVIGAGPAGMFCSGLLAENGHSVILLEKNEKIGKKLYITGKGRCNVTNNSDRETLLNNIISNPKFAISALSKFSPKDTMNFIEKFGVQIKIERGNRVYPISDKSSDIIKAFEKFLKINCVDVKLNTKVLDIKKVDEQFKVTTNNGDFIADKVIIATGGISYPLTGSTGDGYKWAKSFNHNIVELRPGLCGLVADGLSSLSGLSLKNVRASIYSNDKLLESEFGEMLFTHIGVSGPIILTLTSRINKFYIKNKFNRDIELRIDLKPALDEETLDLRLIKDFTQKCNMDIKNILVEYMPKSLIPFVLKQAKIKENIKANSINKQSRKSLILSMKSLSFKIKDIENIDSAIITSGGVDIKDINPKNMESKLCSGLFFIGEVLDIDALTGGFNIQLALSTAYVAAKSI